MTLPNAENELAGVDALDMYHKIIHLPEQVLNGYANANPHIPADFKTVPYRRLVLCGMGGSAIAGDIIRSVFGHLLPIEVVKDYTIPVLTPDTLVVVSSYSGSTEESLSCFRQALAAGVPIAAVTSGGTLKAEVDGRFPWVALPDGYPPRSAVGFLFFGLLRLLEWHAIIPAQTETVKQVVANLIIKAGAIAVAVPEELNLAKQTAALVKGRIPVLYAGHPFLEPLAYRWKCQINENAKYPAFSHTLPEMCHNEIEGWESKSWNPSFLPVFFTLMDPEPVYARRLNALKQVFDGEGIEYLEFFAEGSTRIEQIFGLLYLGDMVSYYLALLGEVDPTAIRLIQTLKNNLQ
jgi:glucose/mannose-6-phosphate isomerase